MNKSARRTLFGIISLLVCAVSFLLPFDHKAFAQGEVLGDATTFTESQMNLLIAKPAVVQISNIITGEMTIQATLANSLGAPSIAGDYYEFVLGFGGSGFFVTDDGYLITNGHVAKPEDDLVAYYACYQLGETVFKDAVQIYLEAVYGYSPTESEIQDYYDYILWNTYSGSYDTMVWDLYATDYKGGNLKMDNVKNNNYIQTGAVVGTQTYVQDYGKAATIVDTLYEGDYDSKDLALLKVDGSNFPTVELGSYGNVQIGSDIYIMGYPGVAEEETGTLTDVESELEPTITKGIISAKKTLIDGTEAFQTDAAVSGGNSGGPALDTNGNVIGVATWGLGAYQGAESYNFLISVEKVQNLLAQNNITASKGLSTQKWEEALDQYSQKCYTNAKKKFEEAKTLYADNVDIDDFISKCQTAIENGEDECLSAYSTWMIVGGVLCCLVGVAVVVVLVFVVFVARRKKPKAEEKESEKKKSEGLRS